MSQASLLYWNDKFAKNLARESVFMWQITGAKTVSPLLPGQPGLAAFDAITQAQLDAQLGTADEVAAAKFDATAMGTDMFALVANWGGQMEKLVAAELKLIFGTGNDTLAIGMTNDSGLTDSTAATEATVTSNGNLAARWLMDELVDGSTASNFDSATSGFLQARIYWVSK